MDFQATVDEAYETLELSLAGSPTSNPRAGFWLALVEGWEGDREGGKEGGKREGRGGRKWGIKVASNSSKVDVARVVVRKERYFLRSCRRVDREFVWKK